MDKLPEDWMESWRGVKEYLKVDYGEHQIYFVHLELGKELFWGVYDHWVEFGNIDNPYPALFRDLEEAKSYALQKLQLLFPDDDLGLTL